MLLYETDRGEHPDGDQILNCFMLEEEPQFHAVDVCVDEEDQGRRDECCCENYREEMQIQRSFRGKSAEEEEHTKHRSMLEKCIGCEKKG